MVAGMRSARLGREVYVLSPDGEVIRTVIARLEKDGYQFLNGDDSRRRHWFDFNDAVSAANDRIAARQAALRKELRALAHKRRALEKQGYRDSVVSAPYRVVDLRDNVTLARARSRVLKKVLAPLEYLEPDSVVYVIITPLTRCTFGEYRPHTHFVLETEVRSVCFSPDGQVHYSFSTPFIPEEFSPSREGAEARLQSYSEPGTERLVHFVSSAREKEELEKIEDDIPF